MQSISISCTPSTDSCPILAQLFSTHSTTKLSWLMSIKRSIKRRIAAVVSVLKLLGNGSEGYTVDAWKYIVYIFKKQLCKKISC